MRTVPFTLLSSNEPSARSGKVRVISRVTPEYAGAASRQASRSPRAERRDAERDGIHPPSQRKTRNNSPWQPTSSGLKGAQPPSSVWPKIKTHRGDHVYVLSFNLLRSRPPFLHGRGSGIDERGFTLQNLFNGQTAIRLQSHLQAHPALNPGAHCQLRIAR